MKSRWMIFPLIVIFGFFPCIHAFGQDISFRASVDRKKAGLDSTIILDLTVTGVQNASAVQLPEIDGFRSRYVGPSTSISIINGQQSSSVSQKYILYPQKTGLLTIPAFSVTINGTQYETQPIEVEILESASLEGHTSAVSDIGRSADIKEKAFLTLEFSKKRIYVREPLPITIKLYANNISLTDIQFPVLRQDNFEIEDFERPTQYQDVHEGVSYDVVEFTTVAYPVQSGVFTVDPAHLDCNVVHRRASRDSSLFGGFSEDLFESFFGNYEKYPVSLRSQEQVVEVLPLPAGAPEGFSSAVGRFDLQVSASPLDVHVGDPVTIKMVISGDGDLKNINMPMYRDSDEFKVYDPQIKQQGSTKTLEQVLIPKSEKIMKIPAVRFVYFDPYKEAYEIIERGPFDLVVHPAPFGKKAAIVEALQEKVNAPEVIGRDIVFIKEKPGTFYSSCAFTKDLCGFWIFFALYAAGVSIGIMVFKRNVRIKTDIRYAKRLRAPRKAREGLRAAEHCLRSQKTKEFYDIAYKVLQKYFAEKFSIPEGVVTAHEIQDILLPYDVSLTMMGQIQGLLSTCEMIRYGATTTQTVSLQKDYQSLKEILDYFERV